ncbi:eCIS core domain-containing protein [Streptomyces scopuliridis]|uniref:eCIS core domain-containing protein n=1 Tax=Streptomyces scopuliridis TaxID=452529 RepID=UPI0035DDA046
MSTTHSGAQTSQSNQSAKDKQRKRKARSASRTPEPKNIVSGAGQPLDLSVRRELEEQLGHDFSRVRLHTDRDAGALTDLLGADAVAVGQDIFFREGTYRPGTADGQRLLAHELLHTVQNPDGLGTLRAGRDLGAVSLPQQTMEREAESAAQDLVRDGEPAAREVEEGQATPGWLRYATVDADRRRMEELDPATLVDRLANGVLRSLRGDPEDLSRRTRKQLARLPDELLDSVLVRLEGRLLGSEHDRVLDFVDEIEAYDDYAEDGLERDSHEAPQIEPDTAEEVRTERESRLRDTEERKAEEERPRLAPGPEKDQAVEEGAAGSTPQNGGAPEHGTTPQGGGAPRGSEVSGAGSSGASQSAQPSGSGAGGGRAEASWDSGSGSGSAAPAAQKEQSSSSAGEKSGGGRQGGEKKSQDSAAGKEKEKGGKEATEQQETPAASKEESAAKNRPGAADAMVAGRQLKQQDKRGQEKPKGSPVTSGKDTQLAGKVSTLEGKRNQDVEGLEEESEEDPFGSGSESEVEVGGEEPSAWDIKLQPEDFLPKQDLDVSGVPTADQLDPSSSAAPAVPSFPAPPPTRADEVRARRDAEDAEDEAAEAEPEEETASEETESSAPETEGGPASDGGFGGLALEQAAAPPVPSAASRDPKAGDDPKAGAVAAQTTVQEAPGTADGKSEGGTEAKESAAKEEKGTAAGGDKPSAAPEKESQQATGGQSAQTGGGGTEGAKESSGGAGSEASGSQGAEATRDTAGAAGGAGGSGGGPGASGGTPADGATGGAPSSSDTATSGGGTQASAPESGARTEAPAAAPTSAPAASESATAPAPKAAPKGAPKAASGAKGAPETAPAPKSAPSGGSSGGAGGGGGGAAAPARGKGKKDSGAAPNLSGVSPEAGLATASKLKPHKALQAMGGVGGAVDRTVGDEHKTLASAPPSMQRPAGATQTLEGKPESDAPAQYSQDPAQQAQEPDQEDAEVTGAKEPEGQIEAEKAEEPGGWDTFKMALGFGIGKVLSWVGFEVDAQELAAKFADLPTKDEALKQAQAGNAPGVEMQGGAEQASGEQGSNVDAKGRQTIGTAQDDAGRGMGEDQVYPNAPKEQMSAKVPGQGGGGAGVGAAGGAATGAVPPEAASEVAEHERGPQFQAAFSEGQKGMSEGRQAKDRDFRASQAKHKQQVDAEIATNTETQAGEREKAMAEVTAQREDWRAEQDKELKTLGDKKTERQEKVREDVKTEEKNTDDKVETEKETSDKKVKDKADNAEKEADRKKDGAAEESGNWITKAFEWIKNKVIEIKNAIVKVIREARDAVITFIRDFKKNVEDWINTARKNIIDAIKQLITDLIEFAKSMVRAIIDLAKRIRNLITSLIDAAIALVNRLAAALKQIITDLLDAIGKLLSSILDILKKALQDVLKAVKDAVKAVLDFAAGLLNALGDFMLIAVDFLSDPGGWLGGAKNSAVDGAKNHLFREVKAAVKEWFQSKIEEIIGVPKAILDKLIKGGITLERIVKETWDAIVPQLPFIIGEIVITKVIAKLIPGAGWVMAVIDAIRTAIGALGEILRAMGAVLDWLKSVRSGGAGVLFAKAVAAGIVALLELAYEALLSGIGKYVAKVGRRFKGIAERLGKGKGGKGDGRRPVAGGSDDKGGKRDETPTDRKPESTVPTVRPTPGLPKPGKSTGPGTKPNAKPGPEADPKKPTTKTPAKDTTPSKPIDEKANDGKKPMDTGKPGRPTKNKPGEKPDTRPTPALKPKPELQPKPKPDTDAAPKPKDSTPDKTKGDKDTPSTTKPKEDNDTSGRPKDDGKDAPGKPKPKDDKDDDGRRGPKPDHDGPRRPRPRDDKTGPGKPKTRPDKRGPGRPKSKPDKDRTKKDENSRDSKDDQLRKIVARIRPKLYDRMRNGIPRSLFLGLLNSMKLYYRLTGLAPVGGDPFTVMASLNPSRPVLGGDYSEPRSQPSAYPNPPGAPGAIDDMPKPKLPSFHGGRANAISAEFLSARRATKGSPPRSSPPGWDYITDPTRKLQQGGAWVRAHLLPERLGGKGTENNLVPARRAVNKDLELGIEEPAWKAFGNKFEAPIWYESRVKFGNSGAVADIPTYIRSTFGQYKKIKGTGTNRSDWQRKGATKSLGLDLEPPQRDEKRKLWINTYGATQIRKWLKVPISVGEHIVDERSKQSGSQFTSVQDFVSAMRTRRDNGGPGMLLNLEDAIKQLRKLQTAGKVGWDPLHKEK